MTENTEKTEKTEKTETRNPAYENLRDGLTGEINAAITGLNALRTLVYADARPVDRPAAAADLRACTVSADNLDEFLVARAARQAAEITDDPGPDVDGIADLA